MEMKRTNHHHRATCSSWRLVFLWVTVACSCALGRSSSSQSLWAAAEATVAVADADAVEAETVNINNEDSFDEDQLVQETIAAGRGDRDETGVRDQWLSDAHLGEASKIDTRKPISPEVQRLLKAYRLDCEGCDHKEAVKKVNAYVKETKKLAQELKKQKIAGEARDSWARRLFTAAVVAGLSYAYVNRKALGLEVLLKNGLDSLSGGGTDELQGVGEAQRAEILRKRREQAAAAASQRQKQEQDANANPTWLDNEQLEIWTARQEKQFKTALKAFSGVPKKERYKLIAEKVDGKTRIECLTHHRMQELLAKRREYQSQQSQ